MPMKRRSAKPPTSRPRRAPAAGRRRSFSSPEEYLEALTAALEEAVLPSTSSCCDAGCRERAAGRPGEAERAFVSRRRVTLRRKGDAFPWPCRRLAEPLEIEPCVAEALVAVTCADPVRPPRAARGPLPRRSCRPTDEDPLASLFGEEDEDDEGEDDDGDQEPAPLEAEDLAALGRRLFDWSEEDCAFVTRSLDDVQFEGLIVIAMARARDAEDGRTRAAHRFVATPPLVRFVRGEEGVGSGLTLVAGDGARAHSRLDDATRRKIRARIASNARLRPVLEASTLPVGHLRSSATFVPLLVPADTDSKDLCRDLSVVAGRPVILVPAGVDYVRHFGASLFAEALLRRAGIVLEEASSRPGRRRHLDEGHHLFGRGCRPDWDWELAATGFSGPMFIVRRESEDEEPLGASESGGSRDIVIGHPDLTARRAWWSSAVEAVGVRPLAEDVVERLAAVPLHPEQIMTAAVAWVEEVGAEQTEAAAASLVRLARAAAGGSDGDQTPATRLDEVVLSPELTERLRFAVSVCRDWEQAQRELAGSLHDGYGRAPVLLFSGGPGLGKTLAAEALACELGVPMSRRTGADIRGMWYGQSESRIRALLRKPGRRVVFLEEADGLLRARGDHPSSHIDSRLVNVFLEEIERTRHVVVLATNRPECLDPALARRVLFDLRFELPGPTERRAIWQRHLPASVLGASEVDLDMLKYVPLTGGGIKNASWRAILRARQQDTPLTTVTVLEEAASEPLAAASMMSRLGRDAEEV